MRNRSTSVKFKEAAERYREKVLPDKAPKTQLEQDRQLTNLIKHFGEKQVDSIEPPDVYRYMDNRGAKVSANREKALLSHVLKYCIRWGYLKSNPCRDVEGFKEKPRRVLPTVAQVKAARDRANPYLQTVIDFAVMTGMREQDIRALKAEHLTEAGILYKPLKTQNSSEIEVLVQWTESLKVVVERAKELRTGRTSRYLFVTPKTDHWTLWGFQTAWRHLRPGFHFHDLRALAASLKQYSKDAQNLLGHAQESTTSIYRRAAVVAEANPLPY